MQVLTFSRDDGKGMTFHAVVAVSVIWDIEEFWRQDVLESWDYYSSEFGQTLMSANESLEESFGNTCKRYFYPIKWLLQNKNIVVPPSYEEELEECKLLYRTVRNIVETPSAKGERPKKKVNEELSEEHCDVKSREHAEVNRMTGSNKGHGTKSCDGKVQDQRSERKPKQEAVPTVSRPHNDKTKRRDSTCRTETASLLAPSYPRTIPPGFEKLGAKKEENTEKHSEKSHLVGHPQEKGAKEGVFQATFLERGGRFAKGPDENLTFRRPQSLLLKELNHTEVPESLCFLVNLSQTYFIRNNVRKVVESMITIVERNLTKKESQKILEAQTPKAAASNVMFEISSEPLMSNSSEVTIEDEDIEKIVLTPGLLMNMPYDHSKNTSNSVKQSRVTRWMEDLEEAAEPITQEQTVRMNPSPSQENSVELEKNIDSFLASVRKKTLSKKSNMHHEAEHAHLESNESQAFAYSRSSDLMLRHQSDSFKEGGNTVSGNGWNGSSIVQGSCKYSSGPSSERNKDFTKTWKPAETPSIVLIDPAIRDAKIKAANTPVGVESPVSSLDSKYHSPVRSSPPIGATNGFRQPVDSSHLLMSLLGAGYSKLNSISRHQEDSGLEQPTKLHSSPIAFSPQKSSHPKKAVYAEELEQALIEQTLKSSKQNVDASRTDSAMSLLEDSVRHYSGNRSCN